MQYKMGREGMFLHVSKMLSFPPIPFEQLFLHLKPSLFKPLLLDLYCSPEFSNHGFDPYCFHYFYNFLHCPMKNKEY